MTIAIIILLLIIILYLIFQWMVNSFKNPERKHDRTPLDRGIDFKEVKIPTRNQRLLYGWLMMKNKNNPTLILVHGWGRNVARMLPYIEQLHNKGFNLLTFDARHHGSSDRDDFSTMKKFAEDIQASLDFIEKSTDIINTNYGVIGLSIGGGAAIYASAFDSRIRRVVAVGAFANPYDIMKMQLQQHHIPFVPIGYLFIAYLQNKVGFKFEDIAPEKHIQKAEARFLLIHGEEDKTIPVSHAKRLQNAAGNSQASLWLIPGRGHSDCHKEDGYWSRVLDFFNELK